jgi:hypothetical protein
MSAIAPSSKGWGYLRPIDQLDQRTDLWHLRARIQMKRLLVRHHGIALRLPGSQAAFEELDPAHIDIRRQALPLHGDGAAGFVAGAGTVHNQILIRWNKTRIGNRIFGRNPLRPFNDFRVRQQVEWLANVQDQHILVCGNELALILRNHITANQLQMPIAITVSARFISGLLTTR